MKSLVCLLSAQCFQSSQSGIFLKVLKFIFLLKEFDFGSTGF